MSYFGNALRNLLKRKNMKARHLSQTSGVPQSTVSRLINGEQPAPSPEDLEKLSRTLSSEAREQAELVAAHLQDECFGPGSELVEITIGDSPVRERGVRHQPRLPEHLEESLAVLRECVAKDKDVRDVVEGLGNLLRFGDVRTKEEGFVPPSSSKIGVAPPGMKVTQRAEKFPSGSGTRSRK